MTQNIFAYFCKNKNNWRKKIYTLWKKYFHSLLPAVMSITAVRAKMPWRNRKRRTALNRKSIGEHTNLSMKLFLERTGQLCHHNHNVYLLTIHWLLQQVGQFHQMALGLLLEHPWVMSVCQTPNWISITLQAAPSARTAFFLPASAASNRPQVVVIDCSLQ